MHYQNTIIKLIGAEETAANASYLKSASGYVEEPSEPDGWGDKAGDNSLLTVKYLMPMIASWSPHVDAIRRAVCFVME